MKKIVIEEENYESYKTFYEIIYKILDGKDFIDWEDYPNLNYSASMLDEFLWYNKDKDIEFIFENFNLEKIENQKNMNDYEWKIIFKILNRFTKEYPNNIIQFVNE